MGTAIVGIVAYQNPGQAAGLAEAMQGLGVLMVALSALLAVGLGIPYVARWLRYPDAARADLSNPVMGALYATFPAGLLVLAVGIATVGPSVLSADATLALVAVLAAIGIVLAFVMSVVFAALLFTSHGVEPQAANGGWFIPPVVMIIVPMVLAPLAPRLRPPTSGCSSPPATAPGAWASSCSCSSLPCSTTGSSSTRCPRHRSHRHSGSGSGRSASGAWRSSASRRSARRCGATPPRRRRGGVPDRGHGALGVRPVVARGLCRPARCLPAARPAPVRAGLVGLHVPVGGVRGRVARARARLASGLLEAFASILFVALVAVWLVVAAGTLRAVRSGAAWRR